MSKKTKTLLFWSFLPLGIMLASVVQVVGHWQIIVCCILYGLTMLLAGMVIGIAHAREQENETVQAALDVARAAEEKMSRAIAVAQGVVSASSDVVALSVAERMVEELMANPQNDEQAAAAQEAAKRVANEESEKIKRKVGAK